MTDVRMFRAAVGGREGSHYGYGSWIESWQGDIYLDTTIALLDESEANDEAIDAAIEAAQEEAWRRNDGWEN